MKKRLTAIILMLSVFTTGALAATTYKKSIEVEYGITLDINGSTPALTDANGKTVQPFVYNGTTYVPIRAVAENMGASVGYFSDTDTAQIWQDDKEAMFAAHKIERACHQFADTLDVFSITLPSTLDTETIDTFTMLATLYYEEATEAVDYVIENNNVLATDIVSISNELIKQYDAYTKAINAFKSYSITKSKMDNDAFYTYARESDTHGINCKFAVNDLK